MRRHTWWIAHFTIVVLVTLHIARYALRGWDHPPAPGGWISLDFRKFVVFTGAIVAALDVIISTLVVWRLRKRTIFHLLAVHVVSPVLAVFFAGIVLKVWSEDELGRLLPDPPGWTGPP